MNQNALTCADLAQNQKIKVNDFRELGS